MLESILTISIAGFLAGFIFSMPIAGPVSVLIVSNALKGKLRYCNLISLGASIADFIYIFIAVFGLTKLYTLYKPAIPYLYVVGSLLFFFLGYKIIRTKIDIEHLDEKDPIIEKIKKRDRGAFYTGFMINFLNPTLFLGGLTSSFFVISLIASLGLHTGGLAVKIDQNINEFSNIRTENPDNTKVLTIKKFENIPVLKNKERKADQTSYPSYFHFVISSCYAFFLSVGIIVWFYLMAFLIVRFRQKINVRVISGLVKSLGGLLWILGLYFGYLAIEILF
jgi:threonine/homoserine/homoserine lactone efflux protein